MIKLKWFHIFYSKILLITILFSANYFSLFSQVNSTSSKRIIFYYLENSKNKMDVELINNYFNDINSNDSLLFVLINNSNCKIVGQNEFTTNKDDIIKHLYYEISNSFEGLNHNDLNIIEILNSISSIFNKHINSDYINGELVTNGFYEFNFIIDINDLSIVIKSQSKFINLIENIQFISLTENKKSNFSLFTSINKFNSEEEIEQLELLQSKISFSFIKI